MEVITKETRTVLPWSENEVQFINWVIEKHPEWDNAKVVNQFKYEFPENTRTDMAITTKLGNSRINNKRKLKWNEKALRKLSRLVKAGTPRAEIAAYFKVTESAVASQITKVVKLKYLKPTQTRVTRPYERVAISKPVVHGAIPEIMSSETEVVVAEQLSLPEVKEEVAISNTISASSCNISAKIIANHKAMSERRSAEQEFILKGIVQVAENISRLMSDTLQMLKGV